LTETSKVRLNVALRELNISLDRAVEFLSFKKIEIEARPTAKISRDVYQLLLDEFETDKSKKDASHEISEEKKKEKETIRVLQEIKEKERLEQQQKRQEVIKAKVNINKPVTLGKIDLDTAKFKKPESPKNNNKTQDLKKVEKDVDKKNIEIIKENNSEEIKNSPASNQVENDVDASIKTKYTTLSGPKMTGQTIDLDEFKKKEKTVEDARKRKRKRTRGGCPLKYSVGEKKKNQTRVCQNLLPFL
jgi:translation initiation factor IF-2